MEAVPRKFIENIKSYWLLRKEEIKRERVHIENDYPSRGYIMQGITIIYSKDLRNCERSVDNILKLLETISAKDQEESSLRSARESSNYFCTLTQEEYNRIYNTLLSELTKRSQEVGALKGYSKDIERTPMAISPDARQMEEAQKKIEGDVRLLEEFIDELESYKNEVT